MSKVIYEVTLSPDGKHCVSVKSDDPILLKDALPLAKKIQARLLQVPEAPTPSLVSQPSIPSQNLQQAQAPLCGVHSSSMVSVQGKRGAFWSCHKRNEDGSWCTYKPKPRRPAVGSIRYSPPLTQNWS
jgi:hypothetical protein